MMYGTDNGPICPLCGIGGIYTYERTDNHTVSPEWQEWESTCRICGDTQTFVCDRTEVTIHDLKQAHADHLAGKIERRIANTEQGC